MRTDWYHVVQVPHYHERSQYLTQYTCRTGFIDTGRDGETKAWTPQDVRVEYAANIATFMIKSSLKHPKCKVLVD